MQKILFFVFVSAVCIGISSCEKKLDVVAEYDTNADNTKAFLKFVHASPNFRQIWNTRDSLNLFVNDVKLNTTNLTYNSIFPFSVNSSTTSITATYAAVPAGNVRIKLSNPGATSPDSFAVMTLERQLDAGKYYTFMLTDSIKNDRDSSKIFINDEKPVPALPGNYNLRFIYASANAVDTIDVFSFARNANIISNLRPNAVTGFIALGYNVSVADTIMIKRKATPAGTGPILAKFPLNAANVGAGTLNGRSFTLYYKGDATVTTGAKSPSVSAYLNF